MHASAAPSTTAPVNFMSLKGMMKQIHIPCDRGKYYGYPECCIKAFERQSAIFGPPKQVQCKVANRKGFIPCMACCRLIIDKKIKIEDLIKNRECELSFPNCDGKRIRFTHLAGWISLKSNQHKMITKRVKFTHEYDYNSILSRILINKIIIRRTLQARAKGAADYIPWSSSSRLQRDTQHSRATKINNE